LSLTPTLITDFDGTITDRDFYYLAVERYLPPNTPDYWASYSLGQITHLQAMQGIFGHLRASEEELAALLPEMKPEPRLKEYIQALKAAGWAIEIVSNGCEWYIDRTLRLMDVTGVTVYANPGGVIAGQGLRMEAPLGSPYLSSTHGIDKVAVLRAAQLRGGRVVFAGNGPPDEAAALRVDVKDRFARGWLAEKFKAQGVAYRPFERWGEVAEALLQE